MERPYIGKSKNELTALAASGDAAAQAELDYRANKKGGKAPVAREIAAIVASICIHNLGGGK